MVRWVAALVLVVPFVLLPGFVEWQAHGQAARLGQGLALVADSLGFAQPRQRERDREEVGRWRAQLDSIWDEASVRPDARTSKSSRQVSAADAKRAAPQGLFVTAEKVLSLAAAGARPSAIAVQPAEGRPGGLMLIGVGGLGVGLRDGDILTQAIGRPAVSEASVVGAVVQARGARKPQLSGRIWRDGVSFPLVVEQPYVNPG